MVKKTYLKDGFVLKDRYKIVSVIGSGGFGITYQAVDELLNCYVAVKEFFPENWAGRDSSETGNVVYSNYEEDQKIVKNCLRNFEHEARILEAAKDVPYIARIRDYFEENSTKYIVLKLIYGQTLFEYMKELDHKLSANEVLTLLQNTFDTLVYLHKEGIIHRDINPGNLMISQDQVLYLIDFGSATSFQGEELLQSQQVFEHKGFEAPEHSRPDLQGPWTDIFSLCATIVYLITGEGFSDTSDDQYMENLPQLLMRTSLSSRQQNALIKGLNPNVTCRYYDIRQLHKDLYGESLQEDHVVEERKVFYHAKTITGSRKVNQDNFMVDQRFYYKGVDCEHSGILVCHPEEIHIAAVCDGVGGSNHGELAAKAVIQALIHFVEQQPRKDVLPDRLLEDLLDQINEKILQLGEKIGLTATTLVLLLWKGDRFYAVNIGDSPIFLLRKKKLEKLSTSQTRADLNIMTQKPVQKEDWNTLMQFLGKRNVAGSQMAAFRYGKLQEGDIFLICSDGVSKKLVEDRLKTYLMKKGTKSITSIFKSIEKNVQNDNCTAVVLKF